MKYSLILLLVTMSLAASAQKFAYVDTDYVLSHMQEYVDAQAQLNELSTKWQEEIEEKYASIQRLEEAYNAEKVLLTDEMRSNRESEIEAKRMEALELQKGKFGVGGELFNKREELIGPIQEQIYSAIQEVASNGNYLAIFDQSNQSNILYANPKINVSDKVLKKMGLVPGEVKEQAPPEEGGEGSEGKGGESGSPAGRDSGTNGAPGRPTGGGKSSTVPRSGKN